MDFTLHVENLRALRKVEWAPRGVCALVGANGSGKSTLLQVLRFLNLAVVRGIDEAFRLTFVSSHGLLNRSVDLFEEIRIGVELESAKWSMELVPVGASIGVPPERFTGADGGEWRRLNNVIFAEGDDGVRTPLDSVELAKLAIQQHRSDNWGEVDFVRAFQRFRVFHDPDLWSLRTNGSPIGDPNLHSRGLNAFAILRLWNERREHRHRYQFVLDGLRAAFPTICNDLDFESAGQTTFVRLWPPASELSTPISNEANGVLALLVYLCDIASGEPGGLVAIDEPENSLHPHAIRELVQSAQAWSDAYDTTIVLATHSPVILNELTDTPEQVWVMRTNPGDDSNPTRLDQLKNPDWLRQFALGTLYASGELGSNDDAA